MKTNKIDYLVSLVFFLNVFIFLPIYFFSTLKNGFVLGLNLNADIFGISLIFFLILFFEIIIAFSVFISYFYSDYAKSNYNIFINSFLMSLAFPIISTFIMMSLGGSIEFLIFIGCVYIFSIILNLVVLKLTDKFRIRVKW